MRRALRAVCRLVAGLFGGRNHFAPTLDAPPRLSDGDHLLISTDAATGAPVLVLIAGHTWDLIALTQSTPYARIYRRSVE